MAVWSIPAKILIPAGLWEGCIGRLADGRQVLGYGAKHLPPCVRPRCLEGDDPWAGKPSRWAVAVHLFDADGHHLACHSTLGVDPPPASPDGIRSREEMERDDLVAAKALQALLDPLKAGGWEDADIRVRPFYLVLDGVGHGLACEVEGDDPIWDDDYDPQVFRLHPIGYIFHRPWDAGEFST
jgi:hypothetical protein